jgi:hypothetical protein
VLIRAAELYPWTLPMDSTQFAQTVYLKKAQIFRIFSNDYSQRLVTRENISHTPSNESGGGYIGTQKHVKHSLSTVPKVAL